MLCFPVVISFHEPIGTVVVAIAWYLDFQLLINTNVVSSNPAHEEVHSLQYYEIKFVSDLRYVGEFLRVHRFPPPIKLTTTT
jgi:hypothetical protein